MFYRIISVILLLLGISASPGMAAPSATKLVAPSASVAVIDMHMMILPGTAAFLQRAISEAHTAGAEALVIKLSTPGGMLQSSQEMIQEIFQSPIPVIVYVSPGGATATSAGVFITLAGHIAAMSPGSSMGAAHPVQGDGKDIEGDMRAKAEQMTIAMVKSIAENRGRNVQWAEKSVKESSSITEKEALAQNVVDVIASDIPELLKLSANKTVKIGNLQRPLGDLSALPQMTIEMNFKERSINVLANPSVAALLWLGATTGLSLELYNPGAILPGVVGVICLVLALAVSQIIPMSQSGLLLLIVGCMLIGLEFYVPSGILGIGGVVAIVLGAIYLVDVNQAPGLTVDPVLIGTLALLPSLCLFIVTRLAVRVLRRRSTTGADGLVGQIGVAFEPIAAHGRVSVNGEIWNAFCSSGMIEKDSEVEVVGVREGLQLEVIKKKVNA